MKISIHQPNFLPWEGYFWKILRSDIFVILDNVPFSKGSYTNRTKLLVGPHRAKWLTLPVSSHHDTRINEVLLTEVDWHRTHREKLESYYRMSPHLNDVLPILEPVEHDGKPPILSEVNYTLVGRVCGVLGLDPQIVRASEVKIPPHLVGQERLIALINELAPGSTYLSGQGGAKYQDAATYAERGITLEYSSYNQSPYMQLGHESLDDFLPGLSIIDTAMAVGWDEVRRRLTDVGKS